MLDRILLVLARTAFGVKFAHDGYNNLVNREEMIGYAESVGVPAPNVLVPAASFGLLVGGVLLALGIAPLLGVAAIAAFLLGVTPQMHDFWNMEDEQRGEEFDRFARNVAFLSGAIAFGVAHSGDDDKVEVEVEN